MSSFKFPQPVTIPVNDELFINVFDYYCPVEPFMVPKGFVYDLASIPWLATGAIPKDGLIRAAALCHDFLCDFEGQIIDSCGKPRSYSWGQAARVFKNLMLAAGIPKERAATAYQAVMAYGAFQTW